MLLLLRRRGGGGGSGGVGGIAPQLADPVRRPRKAGCRCEIKDDNRGVCTTVVEWS